MIEQSTVEVGYPAYQLYKDNKEDTYCTRKKVKNHDEGSEWIGRCIAAHPGTSCKRVWLSEHQSGIIW